MSARREKLRRLLDIRYSKKQYRKAWERWKRREPPKWKIISHWIWSKREPKWGKWKRGDV